MPAQYRLDVKNASGVKVEELIEFTSLAYTKRRNEPGELTFTLNASSPKITNFVDEGQVEVWRRNTTLGLDWYCDFYGLFRKTEEQYTQTGTYTATCPGQMVKLSDRIVAYYSGAVSRSYFTVLPAETILNTLAVYNLTSAGSTADGRVRNATMTGVTVETNLARGSVIALWDCAEENLLETMQALADQYKVAFDLVPTGANTWQWRYITNTDVSADQVFSLERGNVSSITIARDRLEESTVAIVGGKGEGILRDYSTVTNSSYHVSTNNRERFVSATNEDDAAGREYQGNRALREVEARTKVAFNILQTPSSYYGLHYNLHHVVTGRIRNQEYQYVVAGVSVDISSGKEDIQVTIEDV